MHVDAWLNQWKDGAPRSRARRRSALFSFYEHAVREGIVPGNPVRAIRPGVSSDMPGRPGPGWAESCAGQSPGTWAPSPRT
ncbi:hypothetical protein OG883_42590 [Streptomyces sp. NBC_01142]|nr:hypothetical protein [Streptomyces sp. NBC_01142]